MSQVEIKPKKVLFISSSGGHWIEIRRLEAAFNGFEKCYISTDPCYKQTVTTGRFYSVINASRWNKFYLIIQAMKIFLLLRYIRPDVVISTGAAPGFFGLFFAKKMKIKTIWVDSLANMGQLSLSGQKVRPYADLWLTQWEHLSTPNGPSFHGAVL